MHQLYKGAEWRVPGRRTGREKEGVRWGWICLGMWSGLLGKGLQAVPGILRPGLVKPWGTCDRGQPCMGTHGAQRALPTLGPGCARSPMLRCSDVAWTMTVPLM